MSGAMHDISHAFDIDIDRPQQRLRSAISCIETGIGIEVWTLEKAWPGVCQEISLFDVLYPDILHAKTIAPVNAMLSNKDTVRQKFTFDCPVFVAESRHGWPRTCNNVKSSNMAELRRHLTKRPGRGYTAQLAFLELCPTCNEDFLDSHVFRTRHGSKGDICNSRRPQRKGEKAKEQWELLYRQVEKELAVQHLPARKRYLSLLLKYSELTC